MPLDEQVEALLIHLYGRVAAETLTFLLPDPAARSCRMSAGSEVDEEARLG